MEGWKRTAKTTSWAIGTPDTVPDIVREECGETVMRVQLETNCVLSKQDECWKAKVESLYG